MKDYQIGCLEDRRKGVSTLAKKKIKVARLGKSYAQERHAERRFLQRTGIVLTTELHGRLTAKIRKDDSDAVFVEKQSNRVSVWDVTHKLEGKKITFRIVYDKMRRNIVTVLNNVDRAELFLFDPERRQDV